MGNNQVGAPIAAGTSNSGAECSGAGKSTDSHSFGASNGDGISAASFGAGSKADGISSVQLLHGVDQVNSNDSSLGLPPVELHDPSAMPDVNSRSVDNGGTYSGNICARRSDAAVNVTNSTATTPDAPITVEDTSSNTDSSLSLASQSTDRDVSAATLAKLDSRSPDAPWINSGGETKTARHARDHSPMSARRAAISSSRQKTIETSEV